MRTKAVADGRVKKLLNSPYKWTKGADARTKDGHPVVQSDPDAVCWCITGAITHCYGPDSRETIFDMVRFKIQRLTVFAWNDRNERTFDDIVELMEDLNL